MSHGAKGTFLNVFEYQEAMDFIVSKHVGCERLSVMQSLAQWTKVCAKFQVQGNVAKYTPSPSKTWNFLWRTWGLWVKA